MNGHLNDEQWAVAVLREHDEATARHLGECAACRNELTSVSAALDAARRQTHGAAELPEVFWRRQRESIDARRKHYEFTYPWRRWVWVTATITLILLASAVLSRNTAPPAQTAASTDADDALLLSVQQSIATEVPRALRPATLLTEEMGRAEAARQTP